jgi:hypothetical protein
MARALAADGQVADALPTRIPQATRRDYGFELVAGFRLATEMS